MVSTLKTIHISLAVVSFAGFVLRGIWMFRRNELLDRMIVRVSPHVVDTAFLLSGIWLVMRLRLDVLQQGWLIAKFVALIVYVVLGAIALRRGKTMQVRTVSFVAALGTYFYIVGVALQKSPASWMA